MGEKENHRKASETSRGGEMADTLALGASPARDGGSSPLLGTIDYFSYNL